jgi:hypothetical protein
MKKRQAILIYLVVLLVAVACKKPFETAVINVDHNYLVVDGLINVTPNSVTTIILSRTKKLTDTVYTHPELNAQVSIEAETGAVVPLFSNGKGSYSSTAITLNPNGRYRLRITTSDNKTYRSDFVQAKLAPPIDSLSWKQEVDVKVYAHTHDPQNKTTYYRWQYTETWQYHATYEGSISLDANGRIFYVDSNTQTYKCWMSAKSTNIYVGSSAALANDVISYAPVALVNRGSDKIFVRYSINVEQSALTADAYQYWELLRKNTEQTGTIFDVQPSQLPGNIHNINNAAEPVIGFVSASSITEARIFIDKKDLSNWSDAGPSDNKHCPISSIPQNPNDFREFLNNGDTTIYPYFFTTGAVVVTRPVCVDCRLGGGVNQKPSFWK